MDSFKKCPKCNEWHWDNKDCAPVFSVYFEDYMGDEPKEIHAHTYEDAATKFAEYYNIKNDYCLMNEEIEIRVEKNGVVKHFKVGAEPDVHYSSEEIARPNENQ